MTLTPKHPGTDINCRCYNHHTDPLFIKLTTDYPGDWIPHKQGYHVKWGKVSAYVYRTGSDNEVCVEMMLGKERYKRTANDLRYLDEAFDLCVDAVEYDTKMWHDDWISKLKVFKDCPDKLRSFFDVTVQEYAQSLDDEIKALKEQLKIEQANLRKLNKLRGVLGL